MSKNQITIPTKLPVTTFSQWPSLNPKLFVEQEENSSTNCVSDCLCPSSLLLEYNSGIYALRNFVVQLLQIICRETSSVFKIIF